MSLVGGLDGASEWRAPFAEPTTSVAALDFAEEGLQALGLMDHVVSDVVSLTVKQAETTDTLQPLQSLAISDRRVARARPTLKRHADPGSPVLWPEPHANSKAGERARVSNSRPHYPTESHRLRLPRRSVSC